MGAKARAVVGVCLTRDQIFRKETVKAFEHNHSPDMKFDPQTGKKLWEEAGRCILLPHDPEYMDFDFSTVEPREELDGLFLFHDRSSWGKRETRYLLGGLGLEDDGPDGYRKNNFAKLDPKEIDVIREKVKKLLEPHRLWKPDKFGFWVVHYASC
jgi:hypothetical protein